VSELVVTAASARQLRERLGNLAEGEPFGFDTEASGPLLPSGKMINVHRSELTGMSFAFSDGYACYVPVAHAWGNLAYSEVRAVLEALGDTRGRCVVHGLKHEDHMSRRGSYALPAHVMCTLLLSWIQDRGGGGKKPHGLKSLARAHLGEEPQDFEHVSRGRQWRDVDPADALQYATDDAKNTLRLFQHLGDVPADHPLYATELPFARLLANMERRGVRFHTSEAFELSATLATRRQQTMEEWWWTFPDVSPSSGQQLQRLFGGPWGTAGVPRTKTGLYSTSAATMGLLSTHPDSTEEGRRGARLRLEYQEANTLLSTYLAPISIFASLHADGRIRPEALQHGTRTGRISMTSPTLMNIPVRTEMGRQVMSLFMAAHGCKLVAGDFSQVELAILAHYAGPGRLMTALLEGRDMHDFLGAQVGINRAGAKTLQYAHIYGSGPRKLAAVLHSDVDIARRAFDAYRRLFPEVPRAVQRAIQAVRDRGYARTLGGKVRHLPDIDSSDWRLRGAAERIAVNTPIQGASGYITKLAMLRAEAAGVPCILQVHDSIVAEVPAREAEDARVALQEAMRGAMMLRVPLRVEAKTGDTLVDVK